MVTGIPWAVRVEAHPELTDQLGVLALITGEVLEELGGTGFRDGAQVLDHLVPGHADAVVRDGQRR